MPDPVCEKHSLLLLMKGHPGTGKSSIARALCRAMRCPLVDKDHSRDVFHQAVQKGLSASQETHDVVAAHDWNALSYDVAFATAAAQLELGLHVVLDCPLARPALYLRALEIAGQFAAVVVVIETCCGCIPAWRYAIESRGLQTAGTSSGHKPSTWEDVMALIKRYDGCWEWSTDKSDVLQHHIMVDVHLEEHPDVASIKNLGKIGGVSRMHVLADSDADVAERRAAVAAAIYAKAAAGADENKRTPFEAVSKAESSVLCQPLLQTSGAVITPAVCLHTEKLLQATVINDHQSAAESRICLTSTQYVDSNPAAISAAVLAILGASNLL